MGPKMILNFNISYERPLSKLSENHNINVIGPTELKLWPFKDARFNADIASTWVVTNDDGPAISL